MKKTTLIVVLALVSMVSGVAQAKDHKKHTNAPTSDETITTSRSAPEGYSSSHGMEWGLGFMTGGFATASSAITALIDLDGANVLQPVVAISDTIGGFHFATGGLFKHTLAGSRASGFHVGGGAVFGNIAAGAGALGVAGNAFAMTLTAVAGFHFEFPGLSHIAFHLDGGPAFTLVNTSPSSTTTFGIGGLTPALGASVVYMF